MRKNFLLLLEAILARGVALENLSCEPRDTGCGDKSDCTKGQDRKERIAGRGTPKSQDFAV